MIHCQNICLDNVRRIRLITKDTTRFQVKVHFAHAHQRQLCYSIPRPTLHMSLKPIIMDGKKVRGTEDEFFVLLTKQIDE